MAILPVECHCPNVPGNSKTLSRIKNTITIARVIPTIRYSIIFFGRRVESSVANVKEFFSFLIIIISCVTRQSKAIILNRKENKCFHVRFLLSLLPFSSRAESAFSFVFSSPRLLSVCVDALIFWDVDKESLSTSPLIKASGDHDHESVAGRILPVSC